MDINYAGLNTLKALLNKCSTTFSKIEHKHNKSDISDFPTSMPASDVYSWAKATTKPSYNASEVGADPSGSASLAETNANTYTDSKITEVNTAISEKVSEISFSAHTENKSNPHSVTKSQIGLSNVENKSSSTIRDELTKSNVITALEYTPLDQTLKGSASGLAELDENGKVPSSQLPSFVDDVVEGYFYNSKFYKESSHTTEITGESGKIYIDFHTEKTYRWSGSAFVVVSETIALGETSSTAYRGDRGKIAYDHSQSSHARTDATKVEKSSTNGNILINDTETIVYTHPSGTNPHGTTKSDVGLGNVPNVSTNDQTPTYTEFSTLTSLTSGEKLSVAFGKISKAITDLISHIEDSVKHITSSERSNWDAAKTHADSSHAPSNAQENVIETIKVNGTALTPNSKAVDITVPSMGNGTVTIKQDGVSKGTFTMNQSGDTTIELTDNNTTYSAGTGLSLSGTTFNHSNSVTAGTAQGDASKTLSFGGTFTVPTVSYDAQGHVTGKGTTTMTMPANPNTDKSVYQSATTTSNYRPLLMGLTNSTDASTLAASTTGQSYVSTGLYAQPSTGTIIASTFKGALTGNATTASSADKLTTARTIRTNLASTSTASFDGSANITPGVTGTLPVGNGGTGQTTANAAANAFINALDTGTTTPQDADYYISQYVGGGTTTTTYYRRPLSALWEYIKGKISSVLGLTASSYGGKASTANKLSILQTISSSSSSNSGKYALLAEYKITSTWAGVTGVYSLTDSESTGSGIFSIKFRSSSSITSVTGSIRWLGLNTTSYASNLFLTKEDASDSTYTTIRLYWKAPSTYVTPYISIVQEYSNCTLVSRASTVSTYVDSMTGTTIATSSASSGLAATSSTSSTQDSSGQQINTTYIKGLSVSGTTITYTKGDGTTGTITTQDTNTHYASGTIVNNSTSATSNTTSALTNGNVYLNHIENGSVKNSHKISGSGATTVTTDTSGNIIISSTDNNTTYTLSTITGTLAITKGGTGATTASGARSNLGAVGFIQQSGEPSDQNVGDLWFGS